MSRRFNIEIRHVLFLLLAPLTLAACGKEPPKTETKVIPTVEAGVLQRIDIEEAAVGTGIVVSKNTSEIAAAVSGIVKGIHVTEGALVRKGQPLLEIDRNTYAASYAATQAQVSGALLDLEQKKRDLERAESLSQKGYISRQEYERYRLAMTGAQAQYDSLSASRDIQGSQLGDATVRAPFNGIIDKKYINLGEAAGPQARLFTIVDLSILKIEVQFPQESSAKVRVGQPAVVTLQGMMGEYQGRVTRIGAQLDPMTRALPVEITLANHDGAVRPGMFADVRVATGIRPKATMVPSGSVFRRDRRNLVYVLSDDKSKVKEYVVEVGNEALAGIEVTKGLESVPTGALVAVTNLSALSDSAAVKVINFKEDSGPVKPPVVGLGEPGTIVSKSAPAPASGKMVFRKSGEK